MLKRFISLSTVIFLAAGCMNPFVLHADPADESESIDENKVVMPEDTENVSQMLVVFKEGVTDSEITDSVSETSADPEGSVAPVELANSDIPVAKIDIPEDSTYEETAAELSSLDNVEYIQPNFLYEELDYGSETADDPYFADPGEWHINAVNAEKAWGVIDEYSDVKVAVIDSGCCITHEDLDDNILTDMAYQMVDCTAGAAIPGGNGLCFAQTLEQGILTESVGVNGDISNASHGTKVCGVIAAEGNNRTGAVGVAYEAGLIPINVFFLADNGKNYSLTEYVIKAYDHLFSLIDEGVLKDLRVINMSIGAYAPGETDLLLESYIEKAEKDYGIVSVCAGGNHGDDDTVYSGGVIQKIHPGDSKSAVAVTAVEKNGEGVLRCSFSDFNEYKDIAAPGAGLCTTTRYSGSMSTRYVTNFGGTSAAAPVISGIFALMFAADPELTPAEAKEALYSCANDLTGDANDIFDSSAECAAGYDIYTGYGLADAYASVLKVKKNSEAGENDAYAKIESAVLEKGEVLEFWAGVGSENASSENATFTSSDPSKVSVDENGKITALRQGVVQVTVTPKNEGASASVNIRVLFSDVGPDHNYYNAVYWAADNSITGGYTDGSNNFGIRDSVLRGQVVTFLWRLAGKPAPEKNTQTFSDVPVDHPYYKAIQWASEQKITAGYKDGRFGIKDPCTRGQIVTFLWRYKGRPAPEGDTETFTDIPVDHPYYSSVQWASEQKITAGYKDGSFGVRDKCTRGQMVTFLWRCSGRP